MKWHYSFLALAGVLVLSLSRGAAEIVYIKTNAVCGAGQEIAFDLTGDGTNEFRIWSGPVVCPGGVSAPSISIWSPCCSRRPTPCPDSPFRKASSSRTRTQIVETG